MASVCDSVVCIIVLGLFSLWQSRWSTLTHPFSLFPSKLLLPVWRHTTLTLKKSSAPWPVYIFVSVLSPFFYGKLLEYEAGGRHLCPLRGRTGGAYPQNPDAVMPRLPLASLFWLLCYNSHFKLPSCWTSFSVFLLAVSCPTSPGKLGSAEMRLFLQAIHFGSVVMELPPSFVPGLLLLHWECSSARSAIYSLDFFGNWCADSGEVWEVSTHCAKKLQYVRILRGLSPKIAFNIHSWVWKPEVNSSSL